MVHTYKATQSQEETILTHMAPVFDSKVARSELGLKNKAQQKDSHEIKKQFYCLNIERHAVSRKIICYF